MQPRYCLASTQIVGTIVLRQTISNPVITETRHSLAVEAMNPKKFFVAVDLGATKLRISAVTAEGQIIRRLKSTTPRDVGPGPIVEVIENSIRGIVEKFGADMKNVMAVGLAIPGVVDPDAGRVVFTANAGFSKVDIGPYLKKKFKVPVAVGNDCNVGALGEKWLGSAREADNVMAILVGTGIGGGFVQKSKLWRGARESACEIGHMVMQLDGPKCGCGNLGCFEALAGRRAIERDIRQAVAAGRQSLVVELTQGDLKLIRSGILRKALAAGDELVHEVLARAAEVIGYACISVRHLIDPEVIVLGGGVIEACSDFIVPIVERVVESDNLPGARPGGGILVSSLGDDAVVLGAVAMARLHIGDNPFKSAPGVCPAIGSLVFDGAGIRCNGKIFMRDFHVNVNGKTKSQKPSLVAPAGERIEITREYLDKAAAGGPELLFIGAGSKKDAQLSPEAARYLTQRKIDVKILDTAKAVSAYNAAKKRKAAVFHLGE